MSDRRNDIGRIRSTTKFNTRSEIDGGPCRYKFVEATLGCLNRIQDYLKEKAENPQEPKISPDYSINAHPRWGKSDYARVTSLCALNGAEIDGQVIPPMASAVLFLVPMGNLVGQFIDESKGLGNGVRRNKWTRMESRYNLVRADGRSAVDVALRRELERRDGRYAADELGTAINGLDQRGSCHVIGCTIQLAKARLDVITAWIRQRVKEDPLHRPVLVFWDEIQSVAENEWAKTYQELLEAGAFHVGMTGTISRDDGSQVSGVRRDYIEETEYDQKVFLGSRPAENGKVWVKSRTDRRARYTFRDEADITIPPKIGFERGYLCSVNTFFLDVDLAEYRNSEPDLLEGLTGSDLSSKKLSELPESVARLIIGRLVRVPHIAKTLLAQGLKDLDTHIPFLPDGRMIVFCCADQPVNASQEEAKKIEKEADAHLKQIEKWIIELRPELDGKICRLTGNALNESNEKLSRAMEAFEKSDQRVVLVKSMGNAGWDFPSLCTAVDLSPTRAEVTKAQSIFRPLTPKEDCNGEKYLRCNLVMLADPMNKRIVAKYIQDQGGDGGSTTALIEKGAESERLVTPKDRNQKPEYLISSGRSAVITDQDRLEIDYDRKAAIAVGFGSLPNSPMAGVSPTKIHKMLEMLGDSAFESAERLLGSPVQEPDLTMGRDDLRSEINQNVRKTVGWVMPQLPSGGGVSFDGVMGIAHVCLREVAGVPTDKVKLADLPDEELQRLHLASQTWAFKYQVRDQASARYTAEYQEVA